MRSALSGRLVLDSLATEIDGLAAGSGFSPLDLHARLFDTHHSGLLSLSTAYA